MAMARRFVLSLLLLSVVASTRLSAQSAAGWGNCRADSLGTFNCARYYSGTVTLVSELRGTNIRQTLRVVATVTAGQVRCRVTGSEAGDFEGPGMLAVEHGNTENAGRYDINVWCPSSADSRPNRRDSPAIQVMNQQSTNYGAISGRDEHEHPNADSANGLTGTETITWELRRS